MNVSDGSTVNGKQKVAEEMSQYFARIGEATVNSNLNDSFDVESGFHDFLPNPVDSSVFFVPVTEMELKNLVKNHEEQKFWRNRLLIYLSTETNHWILRSSAGSSGQSMLQKRIFTWSDENCSSYSPTLRRKQARSIQLSTYFYFVRF